MADSGGIGPTGHGKSSWAAPQVSAAATRFALKWQHRPALWNPFRVRVQTGYQPRAAFIRIRGCSCPRLICASLSDSVAALTSSINANTLNAQMSPRTSFVDEPNIDDETKSLRRGMAESAEYPGNAAHGAARSAFGQRLTRNEVLRTASAGKLRWTQPGGKVRLCGQLRHWCPMI